MKKTILGIIIGIVLCSGVVYASNIYKAKDITYNNEKSEVKNVNEALDYLYENIGVKELELIKEGSVSSNIATSVVTDSVNVEIANYKKLLIIADMGNYWQLSGTKTINFVNALVNDKNIFEFHKTVSVGGDGTMNGQVAYIVTVADCIPNSTNEIKIQTQSVGATFSINKNYKIYVIK